MHLTVRCMLVCVVWLTLGSSVLPAEEQVPDAQTPGASPQTRVCRDLTWQAAHAVMLKAIEQATASEATVAVAVVDAAGHLKAFASMDDAWIGATELAIKKARTARRFNIHTGAIGKLAQPGEPLYGIEHAGGDTTIAGGIPIVLKDGTVVGAVGVAGSTVANDAGIAREAAGVVR